MIREEAQIALANLKRYMSGGGVVDRGTDKAINMAIKALEKTEQRWISCKERLPKNREWVLGIFQEGDTGWINPIPFICDYVGKKTPITTQDNWLLKMVDEPHPYYKELHCIAWMPLPDCYQGD